MSGTLSEKVWDRHLVHPAEGEPDLLYIDLHLVHEVTSPQAFDGLRMAGRTVRRPDPTIATEAHTVPTPQTSPPSTSAARSRTRSPRPRSRPCAATVPSSASRSTRWATASRASSTSS